MQRGTICEKALAGEIVGELIIDAHCHLGPWYNFHIPEAGSAQAMVRAMDQCGIAASIIAPHVAIGPDERLGNQQAYDAAEQFPGRLFPFVTINPNRTEQAIRAEIERWEDRGIIGFKIHPSVHRYKASGERYHIVYEYANAHGLPILSHCWDGDPFGAPSVVAGLAERYPNAKFIIGHAASSWSVIETNCVEARRRDNVYLDLTGSALLYGALEYMVKHAGAEKILFGSDNPFLDPRGPLGRVLMARIDDHAKRLILGLNAKHLFNLDVKPLTT